MKALFGVCRSHCRTVELDPQGREVEAHPRPVADEQRHDLAQVLPAHDVTK
jgi:hypothetical protein